MALAQSGGGGRLGVRGAALGPALSNTCASWGVGRGWAGLASSSGRDAGVMPSNMFFLAILAAPPCSVDVLFQFPRDGVDGLHRAVIGVAVHAATTDFQQRLMC